MINSDSNKLDFYFNQTNARFDKFNVYKWYGLTELDAKIIKNTIYGVLDYYWNKNKSNTVTKIKDISIIQNYCKTFIDIFNNYFSGDLDIHYDIYYNGSNYIMVEFKLTSNSTDIAVNKMDVSDKINSIMKNINDELLFTNRILKRYSDDGMLIIKPNMLKYWNIKKAIIDADKMVFDIMMGEKND